MLWPAARGLELVHRPQQGPQLVLRSVSLLPGSQVKKSPPDALVFDAGSNSSLKETFVREWLLNFVVEAGSKK